MDYNIVETITDTVITVNNFTSTGTTTDTITVL